MVVPFADIQLVTLDIGHDSHSRFQSLQNVLNKLARFTHDLSLEYDGSHSQSSIGLPSIDKLQSVNWLIGGPR